MFEAISLFLWHRWLEENLRQTVQNEIIWFAKSFCFVLVWFLLIPTVHRRRTDYPSVQQLRWTPCSNIRETSRHSQWPWFCKSWLWLTFFVCLFVGLITYPVGTGWFSRWFTSCPFIFIYTMHRHKPRGSQSFFVEYSHRYSVYVVVASWLLMLWSLQSRLWRVFYLVDCLLEFHAPLWQVTNWQFYHYHLTSIV